MGLLPLPSPARLPSSPPTSTSARCGSALSLSLSLSPSSLPRERFPPLTSPLRDDSPARVRLAAATGSRREGRGAPRGRGPHGPVESIPRGRKTPRRTGILPAAENALASSPPPCRVAAQASSFDAPLASDEQCFSASPVVQAAVEVLGPNSRRVSASISVNAPLPAVWSVLTDYARLAEFVPSLARNEVLQTRERGARLLQIGEQDVALGLKFQARVVVDVEEEPEELLPFEPAGGDRSPAIARTSATSAAAAPPAPRSAQDGTPVEGGLRDLLLERAGVVVAAIVGSAPASDKKVPLFLRRRSIRFTMREGDFAGFSGRWVLQEDQPREEGVGACSTTLAYTVNVTPHFWLPVALVEGRIAKEIRTNLASVAKEACRRAYFGFL